MIPTPSLTSALHKLWAQKMQLGIGLGLPPPYAMEASNEPILGPKHKSQVLDTQSAIFIQKKHRTLEEEAKALGKLMADNLGSTVTTRQHHWEQ